MAIISRLPLEDLERGLPGNGQDTEARWIEAVAKSERTVRICCLYLPNGNPAPGPKYSYKLEWMERLRSRADELMQLEEPTLIAGDYNVIPQPEDAMTPSDWKDDALRLDATLEAWRRIVNLGFADAFRAVEGSSLNYTFWDFQRGAWERNEGIRIDHFLLSPQCADLLSDCQIDRHVRGWERPSDHVPVWVELEA